MLSVQNLNKSFILSNINNYIIKLLLFIYKRSKGYLIVLCWWSICEVLRFVHFWLGACIPLESSYKLIALPPYNCL